MPKLETNGCFEANSRLTAPGREGEFPVEPATRHWKTPASFQQRLTGSTGNRRTRPGPDAREFPR